MAIPAGLEPATLCLEGRCSIRLSYGTVRCAYNAVMALIFQAFYAPAGGMYLKLSP